MKTSIGHTFGNNLADKCVKSLHKHVHKITLEYGGLNSEINAAYYWIIQFRNYYNKKYRFIKIEDVHHFSEASQFGGNMRQIRGGSIRAFQENLNQVIQLIKVHLMPLLKEIKQAHMYKIWFDRILENDEYLHQELSKDKSKQNKEKIIKFRNERNEAINHLKDKWVSEVDGGKLWTISRSTQEQGLDMTLLPQLFFGTYLDDPFERRGQTLKEQLDDSTYKVDITTDAKVQVARFQYKFYTWLPTAVRDTQTTFNVKIASLRQFYTQIEMHMQFMRPLLKEVIRKGEGMAHGNFFSGFGDESPEMAKLFDATYSEIKVIGPGGFQSDFKLQDLEFTKYGLFLTPKAFMKGAGIKTAVLLDTEGGEVYKGTGIKTYTIKDCSGISREDVEQMSRYEFDSLPTKKVPYYFFKPYATPLITFKQQRRQEVIQTQQGVQQVPFMENSIEHIGHVWNFIEISMYRQQIKSQDIHLLESFIQELGAIKEELLMYLNYQEGDDIREYGLDFDRFSKKDKKKDDDKKKSNKKNSGFSILDILSGLLVAPKDKSSSSNDGVMHNSKVKKDYEKYYDVMENAIVEELWKAYNTYKLVGGFYRF